MEYYCLLVLFIFSVFSFSEGREFCQGENYWCEVGHCCGNGECCTYYYELWWFWLVWFLIVFAIGFCVWQRKRLRPWRDNHQCRNRCNYLCGPPDLYPDILPIPPVKLPSYAEIGECPSYSTPPPPYTCECFLQGATLVAGSSFVFDSPPTEGEAPPSYNLLPVDIIAPLLPRLHPAIAGTHSDTGSPISLGTSSSGSNNDQDSETRVIEVPSCTTPCLSCRNSPRLLRVSRDISRSPSAVSISVIHTSHLPEESAPSSPSGLLRTNNSRINVSVHSLCGNRDGPPSQLLRPLLPNVIPAHHQHSCPARNSSLQSTRSFALSCNLADELAKTLPNLDPNSLSAGDSRTLANEEPDRGIRRNSNSLPRNFACSGHVARSVGYVRSNTNIEQCAPSSSSAGSEGVTNSSETGAESCVVPVS